MDLSKQETYRLDLNSPPVFNAEPLDEGQRKTYAALLVRERELHRDVCGSMIEEWKAIVEHEERQRRLLEESVKPFNLERALGGTSLTESLLRAAEPDPSSTALRRMHEVEHQFQSLCDLVRPIDPELVWGSLAGTFGSFGRGSTFSSIPDWMVRPSATAREAIKEAVRKEMRGLQQTPNPTPPTHQPQPITEPQIDNPTPPTTTIPTADRACGFRISMVSLTEGSPADRARGLVGYISCIMNDAFPIDGVALRCTRKGEYSVSFPKKRGRGADEHYYFRPINEAVRQEFLRQVLVALGIWQ